MELLFTCIDNLAYLSEEVPVGGFQCVLLAEYRCSVKSRSMVGLLIVKFNSLSTLLGKARDGTWC